jgi:uncharacterized protein (DUF305 family)
MEPNQSSTLKRYWWIGALVIAAAITFAVGYFLARGQSNANAQDVLFAQHMTVHHSQAVEMATILRDRTDDDILKVFALDMMLTQQTQIGMMQGWLQMWKQPAAMPMGDMMQAMGMATQEQVNALNTLPSPELEKEFFRLMIRHHQGGVAMAQDELAKGTDPIVKRLAQGIVDSQQAEIDYMQDLLVKLGEAPAPEATPVPMDHDSMNHGTATPGP